jgi:hypothetical protein
MVFIKRARDEGATMAMKYRSAIYGILQFITTTSNTTIFRYCNAKFVADWMAVEGGKHCAHGMVVSCWIGKIRWRGIDDSL